MDAADLCESSLTEKVTIMLTEKCNLRCVFCHQVAWDAELEPTLRDLLPGRPFHPDTWSVVLSHLGLVEPEVHRAGTGRVHAVVARRPR